MSASATDQPWNHLRSEGKGDNLFLSSIVALEPDTGEYVWHYQTSPGESWDHTATQQIIVADLTIDGQMRRVVMQAPKNGFFYVIDATTGKLISAKNFTDISWATHVDIKTGRPVETTERAILQNGQAIHFAAEPERRAHVASDVVQPADGAGVHSRSTATPFIDDASVHPVTTDHEPWHPPGRCTARSGGAGISASDHARQRWRPAHRVGSVEQNEVWRVERAGAGQWRRALHGGWSGVPGHGLGRVHRAGRGERQEPVVHADADWRDRGADDLCDRRRAVRGHHGWHGQLVGDVGAQANAKGNSLPNVSRLLVYTLGGTTKLPAPEPRPVRPLAPPPATAPAATVARGEAEYRNYCGRCHGPVGAVNFGILPDLRYSAALGSKDTWAAVVLGGVLKANGMASFAEVLDAAEADAIRAYVIAQANAAVVAERARGSQ